MELAGVEFSLDFMAMGGFSLPHIIFRRLIEPHIIRIPMLLPDDGALLFHTVCVEDVCYFYEQFLLQILIVTLDHLRTFRSGLHTL